MKITPLEIRQKTFEKTFRGYDKDEVDGYLQSLSQEWERVQDESKELKIKLENSEREVEKLREVENSLFKTLKTAEDTGASMIDQANKAAELHLRETQMRAEGLMSEAKSKAKATLEEAEMKARAAMEEVEEELKSVGQVFKQLQNGRDDFLSNLRSLSSELMEKIERVTKQSKNFDVEEHLNKTRDFKLDLTLTSRSLEKVDIPNPANPKTTSSDKVEQSGLEESGTTVEASQEPVREPVQEPRTQEAQASPENEPVESGNTDSEKSKQPPKSFFDEID